MARLLSTDFRTTAVTLYYRHYSPATVERALSRAQEFMTSQNGKEIQFRLGGGLLGILAAVHAAVEQNYWYYLGFFLLCASIGAAVSSAAALPARGLA